MKVKDFFAKTVKNFFVKTGRLIKSNFGWKSALFLVICLGLLATDLLTKHFAEVDDWQFKVIPGFIEVVHMEYNDGMAFGTWSGAVPFFIALTCIIVPVFIVLVLVLPERFVILKFCLYMAIAGALGNLVDRIHIEKVRDFIYMNFGFTSFICNFADIWLVIGLVLAIIDLLFLNEWAAFPLTKKARLAQAEHKKREEQKKLAESIGENGADTTGVANPENGGAPPDAANNLDDDTAIDNVNGAEDSAPADIPDKAPADTSADGGKEAEGEAANPNKESGGSEIAAADTDKEGNGAADPDEEGGGNG